MDKFKTRSMVNIEERMAALDEGSVRYKVLESAKSFKTSWVGLGQSLYTVWKDKLYKEWGFADFDAYTKKEIGIRKDTALKLVRSYFFLEKEEPSYLQREFVESKSASSIPNYDAVNVLRLARNKKELDKSDYVNLRKDVLDMGKDAREVKKSLTALMREREELSPEEARDKKRLASLRRLVGAMKSMKRDIEASKMLPAGILKELNLLINKVEAEIH